MAGRGFGFGRLETGVKSFPEPLAEGFAGRGGVDGVGVGGGGSLSEELVHQAVAMTGAGVEDGVFGALGISGNLGDPGGEGFLPSHGDAAVAAEHGE